MSCGLIIATVFSLLLHSQWQSMGSVAYTNVIEPTRRYNILDLVISTDEHMIDEVKVGEEFGTSDHRIIRFHVNGNMKGSRDI